MAMVGGSNLEVLAALFHYDQGKGLSGAAS